MYIVATKKTCGDLIAKFGPPPRSLVGSPASWGGGIRGRPGPLRKKASRRDIFADDDRYQKPAVDYFAR